jgi:proteic killer suppression protein
LSHGFRSLHTFGVRKYSLAKAGSDPLLVIQSFRCAATARIHHGEVSRRLPTQIQDIARRKLRMLDAAMNLADLRSPPGNRLEALQGDLRGRHSIRINDQWRLCFTWTEHGPANVEIIDYH